MSGETTQPKIEPGQQAEVKPEGENQQINVRVKNQQNQEIFFKIKKTTKMSKLIDAYCTRQGVGSQSVRFIFDGQRVGPNATPEELGIEDNDIIDCVIQQTGGSN